jgi:hypothetical protein
MSTEPTCDIVTEFAGVSLPPCGRPVVHALTGSCEHGHTRSRPVCDAHSAAFAANPTAVYCEECDRAGVEALMNVTAATRDREAIDR